MLTRTMSLIAILTLFACAQPLVKDASQAPKPEEIVKPAPAVQYEIAMLKDTLKFHLSNSAYECLKTAESLKGLIDREYQNPSESQRVFFLLSVDANADSNISEVEARAAVEVMRKKTLAKFGEKDLEPAKSDGKGKKDGSTIMMK